MGRPIRRFVLGVYLSLVLSSCTMAQSWTKVAGTTNWNTATNWSPVTIPNSATADVIFGNTGVGAVNIASSVQARSLTFTNTVSNYSLTSSASQTLSGVTAITNNAGGSSGAEVVNLANVSTGNLLFPNGSSLTITNNNPSSATSLVIGPNTVIGAAGGGAGGVNVTGVGVTKISGVFASGANQVVGGLTKNGTGTLSLSGDDSNLQGPITLNAGITQLDYTTSTANKLGSGALTLAGGDLELFGNTGSAVTQTVQGGTAVNAGHTKVLPTANGGPGLTFNLNGISRTAGGTLDVFQVSGTVVTTTAGLTNGIFGGWATANGGAGWATKSGSNIIILSAGSASFASGANSDVATNTVAGAVTTNSLRFTAPVTLTLVSTLTLQSGGILLPASGGSPTITGGTVTTTGGTGELIVHVYGSGANSLTINSALSTVGGLTKTGSSPLVLGGNNSGLTGPVFVNAGDLTYTNSLAFGAVSSVNLIDRSGNSQTLSFSLPDNQNATFGPALRLGLSNFLSNTAQNARITLGGVISSPTGVTTPLGISSMSGSTSGFNLTNTGNTFTGDVTLNGGFLGVTADGSLGNTANILFLNSGVSAGGLEFLNNGTTLAHAISMLSSSRVLVNGTNVDTISGGISAISTSLLKEGTGTLVLTGTNAINAPQINAGTLRVAAAANLGNPNSVTIAAGTLAATGTFNLPAGSSVILGPTSGNGTATIDVGGGQTFTVAGAITNNGAGTGALLKTGFGTLVVTGASNTYSGGTTVQQGTLQAQVDGSLGPATSPVTVNTFGALIYAGTTTTARPFALNDGTLTAASGQTVTFNNTSVGGGFLTGPGSFATSAAGSTAFAGGTTSASANITLNGADSLTNFSQGGQLSVAATRTATFTGVTNTSSGHLTVNGTANVSDFLSDGQLTIPSGGTLNNAGSSLFLGGGSRTTINSGGLINLSGGATIELNGGLLVNNGTITGTTDVNYGSLAKGTGLYGLVNVGQGGVFTPGNSPGILTAAAVHFDNTVVSGAPTLEIELAGTTPGAEYDQLHVTGQLSLGGILQVFLIDGFTPAPGQSFDVLDWSSLTGTFDAIQLPALTGGLQWNTSQLYITGVLSVAAPSLPGDYNNNGIVDAADYVVWRKGLGTTFTQNDNDVWRTHFGQTAGSGSGAGANAAVPEPTTLVLLVLAVVGIRLRGRRIAH